MGPFFLSNESLATHDYNNTGIPSLFRNPYNWNSHANILIINSPVPVGYSYCTPQGPAGHANSCGAWNDSRTAWSNANYLENWWKVFDDF